VLEFRSVKQIGNGVSIEISMSREHANGGVSVFVGALSRSRWHVCKPGQLLTLKRQLTPAGFPIWSYE